MSPLDLLSQPVLSLPLLLRLHGPVTSHLPPPSSLPSSQHHVHSPKHPTQWTLQTHTSANLLTLGAKCTTTTRTRHTSPKSDSCCRNFSKCSLLLNYFITQCTINKKNTNNLKHFKLHIYYVFSI